MYSKYACIGDPGQAGKRYAAMKIHELLLSYCTTVLLINSDKKARDSLLKSRLQKFVKQRLRFLIWQSESIRYFPDESAAYQQTNMGCYFELQVLQPNSK